MDKYGSLLHMLQARGMRVVLRTAQGRLPIVHSRAADLTRIPVSGPPNCVDWLSAVPLS